MKVHNFMHKAQQPLQHGGSSPWSLKHHPIRIVLDFSLVHWIPVIAAIEHIVMSPYQYSEGPATLLYWGQPVKKRSLWRN